MFYRRRTENEASKMSKVLIFLNILSALVFAGSIFFSYYSNVPNNGIVNNSIGNVSHKYQTNITPYNFTFAIWGVIYLFQVAWLAYALSNLCRTNSKGPIYDNPVILPPAFHICYIIANLGTIGFVLTFCNEYILAGAVTVWVTTGFGFAAQAMCFNAIESKKEEINRKELITSYILIENGLDVFFSWTYVASCISLAMVLQYSDTVGMYLDEDMAGTIGLALFLVGNVPFYILDLTSFHETCKWMYMGYITYIWALCGSLGNNYVAGGRNSIITIVAIVITVVALIAKIVLTIVKKPTKKKFGDEKKELLQH